MEVPVDVGWMDEMVLEEELRYDVQQLRNFGGSHAATSGDAAAEEEMDT